MAERFAVIGSNSFSGSHMVKRLLASGHEVMGISRSSEVDVIFKPYSQVSATGAFLFYQADLNDIATVSGLLDDFLPEIVINFAAQSMVAQSWTSPEDWYRTNVLGLVALVKYLENLSSLERYVHVSTPEVYGSTERWMAESRDFRPSTPYAVSRAAGDMHLFAMHQARGFPVCFTRAANVYGPCQQLYRIVPRSLLFARLGRKLRLDGGGWATRSFIHISDVVEATYQIAQRGSVGTAYHISTDEIVSVRELVERACLQAEVSFSELVVEGPERLGKDGAYMLDSSHLRSEMGWAPRVSLDEGLKDTLLWIDSHIAALADAPSDYVHKE